MERQRVGWAMWWLRTMEGRRERERVREEGWRGMEGGSRVGSGQWVGAWVGNWVEERAHALTHATVPPSLPPSPSLSPPLSPPITDPPSSHPAPPRPPLLPPGRNRGWTDAGSVWSFDGGEGGRPKISGEHCRYHATTREIAQ